MTMLQEHLPSQAQVPPGKIEVLPRAIAHLAARAAVEVDGVVRLVRRRPTTLPTPPLLTEELYDGVEVHITDQPVSLEIFMVVRYGAPLAEVAQQVEQQARSAVERALGQPIGPIHVRVQGVR